MIPNGTKFPSKTNAYGKKTRYEIATSIDNGKRSIVMPLDQRTRGGVQWAYDTREAAQKACAELNEARARKLVEMREAPAAPAFYEDQANALRTKGEYLAAAHAYRQARASSIGHTRRAMYEGAENTMRQRDAERYNEAYPS